MSVTTFPVLARILKERQLQGTRLGSMAIACAAVDDVSAWILLAVVVVMILNVGLDIGVISPTIYTMMVFMALATTAMTTPLLNFILRHAPKAQIATAGVM